MHTLDMILIVVGGLIAVASAIGVFSPKKCKELMRTYEKTDQGTIKILALVNIALALWFGYILKSLGVTLSEILVAGLAGAAFIKGLMGLEVAPGRAVMRIYAAKKDEKLRMMSLFGALFGLALFYVGYYM